MREFELTDIIGVVGGLFGVISFIPQILTLIKNRSSRNISIAMYFFLLSCQLIWLVYGIVKKDLQIMVTNAMTSFLICMIIGLSFYFRNLD